MSYALHQNRASQEYQDGLHHQQQAIFRNTSNPGGASWQFLQLIWCWRKHAVKPVLRTSPLVVLALLNMTIFGLAGIFSSEVTKAAGNETLIRSPNCGILNGSAASLQNTVSFNVQDVNDTLTATTYSRACYDNAQNSLQCSQYTRQTLPWTANQNASCPFAPEICIYGGTAAYEMDTGLLDSHKALGINAPKSDRVEYRKVTTCSPLHAKGYATVLNDTNSNDGTYGDTLIQYGYGNISGFSGAANYSYQYDLHGLSETRGYTLTYAALPLVPQTNTDVLLDLSSHSLDMRSMLGFLFPL